MPTLQLSLILISMCVVVVVRTLRLFFFFTLNPNVYLRAGEDSGKTLTRHDTDRVRPCSNASSVVVKATSAAGNLDHFGSY